MHKPLDFELKSMCFQQIHGLPQLDAMPRWTGSANDCANATPIEYNRFLKNRLARKTLLFHGKVGYLQENVSKALLPVIGRLDE